MKKIFLVSMLFFAGFFNIYAQITDIFRQEGIASWYGKEFEGRPTASGEIFDSSLLTAAHPSLPFGTRVTVTNQHNNKSVTVRINDRGPFVPARIIDVSRAAAEQLDMIVTGTAPVKVESIDKIAVSSPSIQVPAPQTTVPQVIIPPRAEAVPAPVASPVVTPAPEVVYAPQVEPTPQTAPVAAPVAVQPVITPAPQIQQNYPVTCVLKPAMPVVFEKTYRLQVGSYKNAHNAVSAFDKLKSAGLNPAYERFIPDGNNEYFRVVLAGVRGSDIQMTTEKLGEAGFREALIKEE